MNKIRIKSICNVNLNTIFLIDGNEIKFKKNKYGNNICEYETEKDEVELNIFSIHELNGKFWFLFAFIFYIISFFGLLNPKYDKKCLDLKYKGKIKLRPNNELTVTFKKCLANQPALTFKGDCDIEDNETNVYMQNPVLKKKLKVLRLFKIITVLLIFVVLFIILYNLIKK